MTSTPTLKDFLARVRRKRDKCVDWSSMPDEIWFLVWDFLPTYQFVYKLSLVCKRWFCYIHIPQSLQNKSYMNYVKQFDTDTHLVLYSGFCNNSPPLISMPECCVGRLKQDVGKAWRRRTHVHLNELKFCIINTSIWSKMIHLKSLTQRIESNDQWWWHSQKTADMSNSSDTELSNLLLTPGNNFLSTLQYIRLKGWSGYNQQNSFYAFLNIFDTSDTLQHLECNWSVFNCNYYYFYSEQPIMTRLSHLTIHGPFFLKFEGFQKLPKQFPNLLVFSFVQELVVDHNCRHQVDFGRRSHLPYLMKNASLFCKKRLDLLIHLSGYDDFLYDWDPKIPELFLHICSHNWNEKNSPYLGDFVQKQSVKYIEWISRNLTSCPNIRFYCNDAIPEYLILSLPRRPEFLPFENLPAIKCYCDFIHAPRQIPNPLKEELKSLAPHRKRKRHELEIAIASQISKF
jgi:hypothetical protein